MYKRQLDDRLAGRLRNLIITLFCFFIASASVELLFPWPWLFAIGLTLSTSGFISVSYTHLDVYKRQGYI